MANASSSSSSSSNKLSWTDRRFVTKAADDGQAEVQVAQLAADKASNPDVKQFAQQMVQDHTQANQQLMSLASSKNVKLDKDDGKDRTYKRLSKASGNDFDREFVEHMVDEHEKDVKLYEKASQNAKDPEVRQFASSTLEHLRHHLQLAQQLQQTVASANGSSNSSWRTSSSSSDSSNPSSSPTGSTSGFSSGSSDMSGHSTNAGTTGSSSGSSANSSSGAGASSSSSSTSSLR
jgi:putative membrane protein